MAHFAKLDDAGIVLEVIAVTNDNAPDEAAGVAFLTELFGYSNWKQTSYNGNIRKNYAGIGYSYDAVRDAFIPPQPYPSWPLNELTCLWESPVPYPADGAFCIWDETTKTWVTE
jgi:hypothetical protein